MIKNMKKVLIVPILIMALICQFLFAPMKGTVKAAPGDPTFDNKGTTITKEFDISNPVDVSAVLDNASFNSTISYDIKVSGNSIKSNEYEIINKTIKIKSAYLKTAFTGKQNGDVLSFTVTVTRNYFMGFPSVTNLTFNIKLKGVTVNATLSPATATFDKYISSGNYSDKTTILNKGTYNLVKITFGGYTLPGYAYSVSGNQYTFKKEYLAGLGVGSNIFTFDMSGGTDPTFTVTISDTTPLEAPSVSPNPVEFDIYSGGINHVPIEVTFDKGSYGMCRFALKDNTGYVLQYGSDYTVNGNNYTFNLTYLEKLKTVEKEVTPLLRGTLDMPTVTFYALGVPDTVLTINLIDTTPIDATISGSGRFDLNKLSLTDRSDIVVPLQLGTRSLVKITDKDGAVLNRTSDCCNLSGQFTFLMTYLDTLPVGTYTYTFDMDGGVDPTFVIEVVDTTITPTNPDDDTPVVNNPDDGTPVVNNPDIDTPIVNIPEQDNETKIITKVVKTTATTPAKTTKTATKKSAKTGDTANVLLYGVLVSLGFAVIVVTLVSKKRRKM
ncbi:MAG: hypothetical protein LBM02_01210 [Lachnospiraceae bacterium]|nr:hypothetical protein [Lachnospiraceae bacterium]